jgi:hypothetical protein
MLWLYERIYVDRVVVDHSPYAEDWYGDDADDGSTMGTLWCNRVV